jgi:hypothetical protein
MRKEDVYKALYDPKYYTELVKYVKDNKQLFQASIKNQNVEHFKLKLKKPKSKATTDGIDETEVDVDLANSVGFMFLMLFILLIATIMWIWALVVLIKYWKLLPPTIQAIGVICLVTGLGGPIVTLILVYIFKGKGDGVNPVAKISNFI